MTDLLIWIGGLVFVFLVLPMLAVSLLKISIGGLFIAIEKLTSTAKLNCWTVSTFSVLAGVPVAFFVAYIVDQLTGMPIVMRLLLVVLALIEMPAIMATGGGGPYESALNMAVFTGWLSVVGAIIVSILALICRSIRLKQEEFPL